MADEPEDKIETEARDIIEMFLLSSFLNGRGEHPEWLATDAHELIMTLWQGGFMIRKTSDYPNCEEMRSHMAECLADYRDGALSGSGDVLKNDEPARGS